MVPYKQKGFFNNTLLYELLDSLSFPSIVKIFLLEVCWRNYVKKFELKMISEPTELAKWLK